MGSAPPLGDALLTVLVPVRNGESLLPGWLDSVERYADAVVALDDGSTDGSRQLLEAHPLVAEVLTNPVRPTYHGWDDLGNRQRLVDAAREAGARWLLFLDADEQIDEADGQALRRFLETEARPGYAYGFEVFRMVDDHEHYDPRSLWVFRLFAAADTVEPLGSQRLHFVPVPSGIPRASWLFTSIRIQHAGSLTAAHRQARFAKYREADPGNDFQDDYANLLEDPELVAPWPVRSPDLPVLLGGEGRFVDRHHELAGPRPAITAVVIAQDDEAVIDRSVDALAGQQLDDEYEVIVVCSGSDGTAERVRRRYPEVRCVQLPRRALPGEARNAGLWMARGEFVTFPGSHVWLLPGSLAARLGAHDEGWDMVTGAVVNGNTSRAGWASYLLDHAAQVPSRPAGPYTGVPGHASYVTADVRSVGGFPEDMRAGEDTVVNRKLYFGGKRTYFCPEATFVHASPSSGVVRLVRHHFQRGRALGRIIRSANDRSTVARLRSTASLPKRRLRYLHDALDNSGDDALRAMYRRVRPLVVAGAVAAASGTWFEIVAGRGAIDVGHPPTPQPPPPAPLLVLSGRTGEAPTGLLGCGSAGQAVRRLETFARYARTVCPVRTALAPIVTSATLTAEHGGTFTIGAWPTVVDAYVQAARDAGVPLLLHVQPGAASLAAVVTHWKDLLAEPGVGLLLDLRPHLAFAGQRDELIDAVASVLAIGGEDTIVAVRGVDQAPAPAIVVPRFVDLREPGTPFPHEALAADPRPAVLVYQ
jgi:glycosyltransferase involved in cell wall biosynthesis